MNEWETKSLEWIHKVREEMDKEIQREGFTLAEWVKSRERIDVAAICREMGLRNFKILKAEKVSVR